MKLLFNPRCSKARQARQILDDHGAEYDVWPYLDTPPSRAELAQLAGKLGSVAALVRTKEALYGELGLGGKSDAEILDALAEHPRLIERPIVVLDDRAFVARPPEVIPEQLGWT